MLTATYETLQKAYEGHHMVPAINTQGEAYDITRAIYMATEELHSPVILVYCMNTRACSGHDRFYGTTKWMASKVSVSVAIHLDHGDSSERHMEMLKLGSTSITFDGSIPPVEENTVTTEVMARVRRSFGVSLEAEIGEPCRLDDRGDKIDASNTADPGVVKQYLKLCHPGSLVIGIGNVRGSYSGPMDIRMEILEECRKSMDISFVLHDCTGMDEEPVRHSIDSGVARISFDTQVYCQYMSYLKERLAEGKDRGHAWKLSQHTELWLCEDIEDIIRFAGSKGKA